MSDTFAAFLMGVGLILVFGATLADLLVKQPLTEEVCTLAFAASPTLRDSVEVTFTYDYCELPEPTP